MRSLGFVEVSGVTAAIDALDIMCKSADVTLVSWERKLGGRLVTLMIEGSVSAVNAAVENACASCIKKPVAHAVIANPHPELVRLVELSASRIKKAEEKTEEKTEEPQKKETKKPSTAKKTVKNKKGDK
ncbi:MAG: BMC domain-containing protein [Clostridia bacterium]|nr:BMC domain-containing protein [Clostridia bacterium]